MPTAVLAVILATAVSGLEFAAEAPAAVPRVPDLSSFASLADSRPIEMTVTEYWEKVRLTLPTWVVMSDPTLWRRMHFDDWDVVPRPVRDVALARIVRRYEHVLAGPPVWETMSPEDWDEVPQPVRAVAFVGMVRHWVDHYRTGAAFGLPPGEVADTVAAIVMVESWFEHRAVSGRSGGNRDLGLAQASDYCRRVLRRWHARGRGDFGPSDADQFNPWCSTRVAVAWFGRLLEEAGGDLGLAVRAYNCGIGRARAGAGAAYLASVSRTRAGFIVAHDTSPTWRLVFRLAARIPVASSEAGGENGP